MNPEEIQKKLKEAMEKMKSCKAALNDKEGEELEAAQKAFEESRDEATKLRDDLAKAIDEAKFEKSFSDVDDQATNLLKTKVPNKATFAEAKDHVKEANKKTEVFTKYMQDGPEFISDQERDLVSPASDYHWDKARGGVVMPKHLAAQMMGFKWAKSVGYSAADFNYAKASTMVSSNNALGGYTVPEDFRLPVLDLAPEPNQLLDRVTIIPAPTGEVTMPKSVQEDGDEFGGMTGNWIDEAGLKPQTDTQFTQTKITTHEYAMYTEISLRLLSRSSIGMENWVTTKARQVAMDALSTAIISGDGNGKPVGILNTAGIRSQARQTAGTVVRKDPINLKYKLKPYHRMGATFIMDDTVQQALELLEDNEGRGLFSASMANGPFDRLSGYPYITTTRTPNLGTAGDLIFIDLREYYLAMEQDIIVKRTEDFKFQNNVVSIAIFMVAGGKLVQPRVAAELGAVSSS